MGFVSVGSLEQFPPNRASQVMVRGRAIALCRVGDALHAVDGICPHSGGPLGHGALHGTTLVCPFHAWEFDCVTGEYDRDPAVCLRQFEVKVQEGDVFINAGAA